MDDCVACGHPPQETTGCTDARVLVYADGTTLDPIPFGDASLDLTYSEQLAEYEREIAAGGRGTRDADWVRAQHARFKSQWTPADYNSRDCPDCGVAMGEYHHPGCVIEECPRCEHQYVVCDCHTIEKTHLPTARPTPTNHPQPAHPRNDNPHTDDL